MPTNYSKNIVYLSKTQYQELLTNQTITVNGTTVNYNENDIYVTPQEEPYIKPALGIPSTDLAAGVQTSLELANSAYQKPSGGIPSTDLASGVIPSVPVQNITVNGASILSNGTAIVPIATDAEVKQGVSSYRILTVNKNEKVVYYGLSKLAGVDLASETVTVGTYPETSKAAINTLIGSISKENLDNAGITERTYTEKFGGEFTVTTATTSGWNNPYARASVTGRINKENMHRVTVNGTEYNLRTRLWYHATNGNIKVYEYLGNLGLYISSTSGVPGGVDNVPFVIISDLNDSSSIDVITQTAGEYIIKVEQINITKTELPKSLIWADDYVPLEKLNNGGTYNGFSIGVNELTNKRGTIAIGYGNKITNEFSIALGEANILSAPSSYAEGSGNEITGFNSNLSHSNHVEGYVNTFTKLGMCNHIEGMNNQGSGIISNVHVEGASNILNNQISMTHVEGIANIVNALTSHIEGAYNIANGECMHVQGKYNVADVAFSNWVSGTLYSVGDYVYKAYTNSSTPYGPFMCIEENSDTTFDVSKWKKLPGRTDTAMLIGNGTEESARSNALKIDWLGNAYFNGNVRVNCNADSTGGTMLPTDIQINSTSVVSNGVANIPIAGSNLGVVKINGNYGITIDNGTLKVLQPADAQIKLGMGPYTFITAAKQSMSVFYGLANAAGDTTQPSSLNQIGTYTNAAKGAIQTMLGINALLAPVESATTTTQAYNVNDIFSHDGKLYKVTTDMLSGDVITPETNCAETTIVDELNELRAAQVEVIRL